jgi:hypothetical protein
MAALEKPFREKRNLNLPSRYPIPLSLFRGKELKINFNLKLWNNSNLSFFFVGLVIELSFEVNQGQIPTSPWNKSKTFWNLIEEL